MTKLLKPGDVLDDAYEIVEFISQGGFGAVYRARQLSMDRDVAVKLLIPGAQPDFEGLVQRFHNEVKAVRNLRHPNTVQIYDFHETADGQLYFTMEYLQGQSLRELIKQGEAISPRRTANILGQVLKSLAEAHSMGIIHRDIKPANIMLVDMYGEDDFVKVLDFGIAKAIHDRGPAENSDEPLTRTGFLVGTVRYMAPERIAGDPAGPYSDIYSLGLVGASLLIGQPILGNSSRLEAMQMQMGTKPLPIPTSVKDSPLGPLLDRALAKSPNDRFQSAEQMLDALLAVPAAQLSASPIHITGEVPILETLADGPTPDTAPTTIDSELQPRPSPTAPPTSKIDANRAGNEALATPPALSSRTQDHETASRQRAPGAASATQSKRPVVIAIGALLLVGVGALAWYFTASPDDASLDSNATIELGDAPPSEPAEADRSGPKDEPNTASSKDSGSSNDAHLAAPLDEPTAPEAEAPQSDDPPRDSNPTPLPVRSVDRSPESQREPTRRPQPSPQNSDNEESGSETSGNKPVAEETADKPDDADFIPVFGSGEPATPPPKVEAKDDEDEEIPVF